MAGLSPVVSAKTVLDVGVYYFPPIATVEEGSQINGLLGDLISYIEAANPKIDFHIVYTSPRRRHLDFDAGLYDIIFFENPSWGWLGRNVTISSPLLTDEELYVALKKPGRNQSFFDDIASRRIVVLSGYHYRLSGPVTGTEELQETFNIELSNSHSRNLKLILANRPSVAEVAVINRSYLERYLSSHPDDRDKLLISENFNKQLDLQIIARKGGVVSANDLYRMLIPMIDDGTYGSLVKKWGLTLPSGLHTSLPISQQTDH